MGDTDDPTPGWPAFEAAEPELAATVRARFGQYTHHALATVRRDGSPRLSGIEADFRFGELWLGMMPNSRKALDLRRDPRFALLANPGPGTDMGGGDVRVSGRAVEVTDPETVDRYAAEAGAPRPFHLFRVEPAEVVRTWVDDDEIVLHTWTAAGPTRVLRRGNDDSPPREDA
ncbi:MULTISPECIES: pyridoxamine 5'-phosphate oxidase family protein [unclassified Streptomyces]|uniref:pyridoxamine 5'-phosphate oxidase family protein n=1 Tax=unclassified Streptomyces TaxID=2593676 RepID=UPI0006F7EB42|nr:MULTISPECIES: pyridoxamine 5'-phosphate oxidase family protein [unclassified Streptomyces]KQX53427.1 pyridoxamine 5'-phosphate oxidase [Streptomyces sp. Root1304]KRA90345.1 pyridoxamine 5'-phosphate oxidase [Streptomyces sp. Root66D1]